MEKYILNKIVTKEFNYKIRSVDKKTNKINPSIGKRVNRINENVYELILIFEINKDNNDKVPFEMKLVLSGEFYFENMKEEDILNFLNLNGLQIVFPHMRSMIASVMGSLMIQPIILPIIDVRKAFN